MAFFRSVRFWLLLVLGTCSTHSQIVLDYKPSRPFYYPTPDHLVSQVVPSGKPWPRNSEGYTNYSETTRSSFVNDNGKIDGKTETVHVSSSSDGSTTITSSSSSGSNPDFFESISPMDTGPISTLVDVSTGPTVPKVVPPPIPSSIEAFNRDPQRYDEGTVHIIDIPEPTPPPRKVPIKDDEQTVQIVPDKVEVPRKPVVPKDEPTVVIIPDKKVEVPIKNQETVVVSPQSNEISGEYGSDEDFEPEKVPNQQNYYPHNNGVSIYGSESEYFGFYRPNPSSGANSPFFYVPYYYYNPFGKPAQYYYRQKPQNQYNQQKPQQYQQPQQKPSQYYPQGPQYIINNNNNRQQQKPQYYPQRPQYVFNNNNNNNEQKPQYYPQRPQYNQQISQYYPQNPFYFYVPLYVSGFNQDFYI